MTRNTDYLSKVLYCTYLLLYSSPKCMWPSRIEQTWAMQRRCPSSISSLEGILQTMVAFLCVSWPAAERLGCVHGLRPNYSLVHHLLLACDTIKLPISIFIMPTFRIIAESNVFLTYVSIAKASSVPSAFDAAIAKRAQAAACKQATPNTTGPKRHRPGRRPAAASKQLAGCKSALS